MTELTYKRAKEIIDCKDIYENTPFESEAKGYLSLWPLVERLEDIVRQYTAAIEVGGQIETVWNCYKEGKDALSAVSRARGE